MGRGLLVLAAALLIAAQVVRSAVVMSFAERAPNTAARAWPGNPAAELSLGMTEIASAARNRRPVSQDAFSMIEDAASKAPLAPEPFLVRGVQAQLAGDLGSSRRAFLAAERRDPRSLPAHYFLADDYFRSHDAVGGLREAAALARLAPSGIGSVAPYVAAYAKDAATWSQLRDMFARNSDLEDAVLLVLAGDAANADIVLSLAGAEHLKSGAAWVPKLLGSLLEVHQYSRARAIWAQASGVPLAAGETMFDPGFSAQHPPPPFNWELMSSAVGLAERQPGGRLHVIFYGQQDGLLARQLLVLEPGRYRMTLSVSGSLAQARGLTWSTRCDGTQTPFAAATLDAIAARPWRFTVPAGCGGQWLELTGVSSDVARQSDFIISKLALVREASND